MLPRQLILKKMQDGRFRPAFLFLMKIVQLPFPYISNIRTALTASFFAAP